MEEKRLTRTERTYLRQHRKCIDPRFEHGFTVTNNKCYSKYCTWFSLYCWFDCIIKNKNNNVSEDILNFISNYKSPSDFANHYLFKNENGKYEYYNLKENKNEKIDFEFNQEYYDLKTIRGLLKVAHQTVDNYLKYLKIEQNYINKVKMINKEDFKKLINWCNKYSKNERANLISKKTTFEKYGVEHALQSKEIQNKAKITCKEHYGVEHPAQSEEVQKLFIQTNLINYGVENPSQSQLIKDRKAETTMNHYGKENPFQAEEVIKICKDTKWKKFGRLYNPRSFGKYEYNNVSFDSKEEVYFYIYHNDILKNDITRGYNFIYEDNNGGKHTYRCDFLLNGENVEIKTKFLINTETMILKKGYKSQDEELLMCKTKCMNKHNVKIIIAESEEMLKIIDIVEEKFPNLVKSCKKPKKTKPRKSQSTTYDITNTIFDL